MTLHSLSFALDCFTRQLEQVFPVFLNASLRSRERIQTVLSALVIWLLGVYGNFSMVFS